MVQWLELYLAQREWLWLSAQLEDIIAGVPQDYLLGSTIFNCFFNDLPSTRRSEVGMFTDDCTMFNSICNSSANETAIAYTENIHRWPDKWQVTFRPHQWQTITISNQRASNHPQLTFNGITTAENSSLISKESLWMSYLLHLQETLKTGLLWQIIIILLVPQSL